MSGFTKEQLEAKRHALTEEVVALMDKELSLDNVRKEISGKLNLVRKNIVDLQEKHESVPEMLKIKEKTLKEVLDKVNSDLAITREKGSETLAKCAKVNNELMSLYASDPKESLKDANKKLNKAYKKISK